MKALLITLTLLISAQASAIEINNEEINKVINEQTKTHEVIVTQLGVEHVSTSTN